MEKKSTGILYLIKEHDDWFVHPIRQPANPRARQHPQLEASPQEPQELEEPEEILGSDDEEQEDPNDYCKGGCYSFHTHM